MAIIYLHGFNSGKESQTGSKLREYFPKLITPSYNYIDPKIGEQEIDEIIKANLDEEELIICGSSLGGFWALYFAQKYGLKAVVFNPTLQPHISLKKYLGENTNFISQERKVLTEKHVDGYRHFEKEHKIGVLRIVVLGKFDEVLDCRETVKSLKDVAQIILTDEKHRLSNVERFAEIIKTASNNFPDYTDGE